MASTIAIRLSDQDRADLETAATASGQGISTYMRRVAESEARRIREDRIRAETEQVVARLQANPTAGAEAELFTGGGDTWPDWTEPLPGDRSAG